VAIFFSVIGAFYYIRIVKLMYFDDPQDTSPIEADRSMRFMLSLNGLAVLVLGLVPGWLEVNAEPRPTRVSRRCHSRADFVNSFRHAERKNVSRCTLAGASAEYPNRGLLQTCG